MRGGAGGRAGRAPSWRAGGGGHRGGARTRPATHPLWKRAATCRVGVRAVEDMVRAMRPRERPIIAGGVRRGRERQISAPAEGAYLARGTGVQRGECRFQGNDAGLFPGWSAPWAGRHRWLHPLTRHPPAWRRPRDDRPGARRAEPQPARRRGGQRRLGQPPQHSRGSADPMEGGRTDRRWAAAAAAAAALGGGAQAGHAGCAAWQVDPRLPGCATPPPGVAGANCFSKGLSSSIPTCGAVDPLARTRQPPSRFPPRNPLQPPAERGMLRRWGHSSWQRALPWGGGRHHCRRAGVRAGGAHTSMRLQRREPGVELRARECVSEIQATCEPLRLVQPPPRPLSGATEVVSILLASIGHVPAA